MPLSFPAFAATLVLALVATCARADEAMSFPACVDLMRHALPRHPEVKPDAFESQVKNAEDLRPVIRAATENQPEFKLAVWDYVARLVDDQRIADGREVAAQQAPALAAIADRRGVDPATAVAVFGVETDYGRVVGRYRVVDATLSRACMAPGNTERERHFFSALWLVQEGYVAADQFRGSWAGAFGMTQFMPGTFVAYKESAQGTGPINIIGNPADALATTANFIKGSGWVRGLRWGTEASWPHGAGLAASEREHGCLAAKSPSSSGNCRSLAQWAALGVKPAPGAPALPPDTVAALLAPAGEQGPAWLVTRNYQAIWQYNRSDAYALAIGLLSDAVRGDPAMQASWPTDDPGLGRAEMKRLQSALIRAGHQDVNADGFDGPRTREAITAEQTRLGLPPTGHPGRRILQALDPSPSK